jgi:apolipoprotein D and lipocalin family protein
MTDRRLTRALPLAALLALSLKATGAPAPLPTLDLNAYMGRWHQVALYPNRFQAQCLDSTTATYTLRPDGRVTVLNRCRTKDGWDETGGIARPRGEARVADGQLTPASLEVSFLPVALRWLGVGWGKYDVLQLGPAQQWAIVSEPSQQYLWVLARTPQLDATQWTAVEALLRQRGFDLQRLRREPPPAP